MTAQPIALLRGTGLLSPAGTGLDRFKRALAAPPPAPAAVETWKDMALPASEVRLCEGFDVTAELGRKGTAFLDRATAFAIVACRDALAASGADEFDPARTAVALGTTVGSMQSTSDFIRDTVLEDKPYLVNPVTFPNAVMNCAAGQSAIRLGLKGPNTTLSGGQTAFLQVLKYAANLLARDRADLVLAGAVEEFGSWRAWTEHHRRDEDPPVLGEGAAVFGLARPDAGGGTELIAVHTAFAPESLADAFRECLATVVDRGGVAPRDIALACTGGGHSTAIDAVEHRVLDDLTEGVLTLSPKSHIGETNAASAAFSLAAALSVPGYTLVTSVCPTGHVGAALLRIPS